MKRRYSGEQRAETLATLATCDGNVLATSRLTGIPPATISLWRDTTLKSVAETCEVKKKDLAELFEEYVRVALPVAMEKVKEARANDLMVAVGIATDKMRLLREQSTNIQESRSPDEQRAELEAELARRNLRLDKAS